MLNTTISLADVVRIEPTDHDQIEVSVTWCGEGRTPDLAGLEDPSTNLAARAWRIGCERLGLHGGAKIFIEKRIPLGGGLGGGSADAGAVLRLLSQYAEQCGMNADGLFDIAPSIGADAPYAMRGGLRWVTGIGETVHPAIRSDCTAVPCWIVLPPYGISTPEVFAALRSVPSNSLLSDMDEEERGRQLIPYNKILRLIDNDLTPFAIQTQPALGDLLTQLKSLSGVVSLMSGSGSTIIVLPLKGDLSTESAKEIEDQIRHVASNGGAQVVLSRCFF
jgi:4-diphosphocytidyl-2-C-methyl-D-erythritol kinase